MKVVSKYILRDDFIMEEELLSDINHLLKNSLSTNEIIILTIAKIQLNKGEDFLSIIENLKSGLSFLNNSKKLSQNTYNFYLKIISDNYYKVIR
ncbi:MULTISPECIES: bacteriocin immunity protein [Enterococcus]|uniref:bacteriocin immunity protein n=1 Tax=Enterococcus TaxID=1350 RepID=UPI000CF0AE83|nr:hypothetical protein [Enterococcus faecium]EGP4892439.1 hypothetical protein [Enterococcus faecium]EGP4915297.1 hypothetical protein [Enterococcus faecium]EGP5699534.1 hypothetical protein [Enterococcus faecium]EME3574892.1 hypothetical protein [Enterococcus faecium]EME7121683.1 hypothetical protein [Enterococcus faecium]